MAMIRLTLDEVQKVLRLAALKGAISPTAGPTIGSVADAFGLQPLQVEALLNEVRAREAEAPQWRKLRAIGAGVAMIALLGISFMAWRSLAGDSTASTGPQASAGLSGAQGGISTIPSYAAATAGWGQTGSADGSSPVALNDAFNDASQRSPARLRAIPESADERPILALNRFAKTDGTDLEAAREKAKQQAVAGLDDGRNRSVPNRSLTAR
jgi:uncharacterized iron-regulated membrane protein